MPASDAERGRGEWAIDGAEVVLPGETARGGHVRVAGGRIRAIEAGPAPAGCRPCLDGTGLILAPGFIDLHSDAIEKEIRPRPGGRFPLAVALTELDKRLAACGITTMYHCLCFGENNKNELRTAEVAREVAATLRALAPRLTVRNRIHVRYEVTDRDSAPLVAALLDTGQVDLFSIMDHTPGQGQFTDLEHFRTYYSQAEDLTVEEAGRLAAARMAVRESLGSEHIEALARQCQALGIPMASHDDDTAVKVDWVHGLGIAISEFPVRLEAALAARARALHVLMGAPNVLRGVSLTGNLSGREAVQAGACTMLGSDYAPMSMLHAAFALVREGLLSLPESMALITRHPAAALGLAGELGVIQEGARADLVLLDTAGPVPRVVRTFVNGREVFRAPRQVEMGHAHPQEGDAHGTRADHCAPVG